MRFITKGELASGQELACDICLIGGGPAAISMALRLSHTKHQVLLIAGGDWEQTPPARDLHKGKVSPAGSHEPLETNRRRQFGGGSAVWAGRCMPLHSLDFSPRPWVPESGWPIAQETLLPYLKQAAALCEIGEDAFDAHKVFPDRQAGIIPGLETEDLVSHRLQRYSPPINFARYYAEALHSSPNIRVLLDWHVLALQMPHGQGRVTQAELGAGSARATVKAGTFVLGAGAIENARLLLASANPHFPTGIGNQHDNVGRYYMTHITGTYARLNPFHRQNIAFGFEQDKAGVFCRRHWWIPERAQAAGTLLNTIFYPSHAHSLTENRGPVFTAAYQAAKQLVTATGIRERLRTAVQATNRSPLGLQALYRLGLPALLPALDSPYWGLFFQAEHAPNRESRVLLSHTDRDAYGVPRVEVAVAFQDIDRESLVRAHNLFAQRYRESGVGELLYSEAGFRDYLRERLRNFNSYAHHLGTTRMAADARHGVVDRDGLVFETSNLYVAGSSTFSTGGYANPTLSVVALALRLADHIRHL